MTSDDLIRRAGRENAELKADLHRTDGPAPRPESERRAESYDASVQLHDVMRQIAATEKRGRENLALDNKPRLERLHLSLARLHEVAERDNGGRGR